MNGLHPPGQRLGDAQDPHLQKRARPAQVAGQPGPQPVARLHAFFVLVLAANESDVRRDDRQRHQDDAQADPQVQRPQDAQRRREAGDERGQIRQRQHQAPGPPARLALDLAVPVLERRIFEGRDVQRRQLGRNDHVQARLQQPRSQIAKEQGDDVQDVLQRLDQHPGQDQQAQRQRFRLPRGVADVRDQPVEDQLFQIDRRQGHRAPQQAECGHAQRDPGVGVPQDAHDLIQGRQELAHADHRCGPPA